MTLRTLPRAVIASALMICFFWSGGHAQRFGRNKIQYRDHKWVLLSTPHFDIHYYEGEEAFAARAGLVLEDGYEALSCKTREVLPWRVPVILYSSHNDFLQTNVYPTLLSEGIQAFAEPSRRRIVLPFTSSFKEFQHTAVHELAHVFTFQIVYNRMLDNVFTRMYLPGMPGWVAEGLAEYLSVGWDADADMYVRDAVIHDYLYPFYGISGFYVYKEGQSVFNYIAETYGHEKVLEFLDTMASTRSASVALSRTIGLTEAELFERWSKDLHKHYWPNFTNKTEVEDIGRRLTDHNQDNGYYNTKPILSPDGEKIAFFSDRSRFVEIYVMSALDGKEIKKLVTGARSNRFESLHLLTSSMTWSPDGDRIAFVAKSGGHDAVFVMDVESGRELARVDVGASQMAAPAWSPVAEEIVVSATFEGQTDLVLIDLETSAITRLTNDAADQLTPSFFPDGKRVVYVHYPEVTIDVPTDFKGENIKRLAEMDFLNVNNVKKNESYDIWSLDIASGETHPLVESPGDDTEPVILADGKTIIYSSDVSGVSNLHTGDIEKREYHRFTDVLGGLFTPSVNEDKGRIAFSAFVKGGHDIYVSDDLAGLLAHRYTNEADNVLAHSPNTASEDMAIYQKRAPVVALETGADALEVASVPAAGEASSTAVDTDGSASAAADSGGGEFDVERYQAAVRIKDKTDRKDDGEARIVSTGEGIENGVPGEKEQFRGATTGKYKTRLSPDFIGQGGGLYFSTGFGFGVANSIGLSDMLGDHYAMFAFNFYRNIEDSDLLLTYSYMKGRIDYSVGLFQFKSYLYGRLSSVGEAFTTNESFSERNYGMFAEMSIPFNKFYRMDVELQTYRSKRQFYEKTVDESGLSTYYYRTTGTSTRDLVEPSISLVHDSSFWGAFGPVEGSRWRITASKGVGVGDSERGVSRSTLMGDYRWYQTLFSRNSLGIRALAGTSFGEDPRSFFLGGPTTLRGYDRAVFDGRQFGLVSAEYRFPMIDALIFGFPGRWGFTNIGGTVFWDAGVAWDEDDPVLFKKNVTGLQFQDVRSDIGVGAYFYMGNMLFNLQWAWPTDLRHLDRDAQFHFYLGPTF